LRADQRSGLLANPGFLTARARATGVALVERGITVNELFLRRDIPPPPPDAIVLQGESQALGLMTSQTAQQQVAYRASMPACVYCHLHFDPYA